MAGWRSTHSTAPGTARKTTTIRDHTNTNVVRFYQAYREHSQTPTISTWPALAPVDPVGKIFGGVFGLGELPRINEAYDHLCAAWAAGDHVIDIIGFSRGAATTLDFCHRIQDEGIRRPGSDDVVETASDIRFLGVWDVVAAFGLANLGAIDLNIGHHLSLPKSILEYCFHAMALDERRPSFANTSARRGEVWFRGVHSDVGGGNRNQRPERYRAEVDDEQGEGRRPPIADDDIAALAAGSDGLAASTITSCRSMRAISRSIVLRTRRLKSRLADWTNPPDTCARETPADEQKATEVGAIEVLPPAMRRYVAVLWETAVAAAGQLNFPIDGVTDALLTLFQGRCVLITKREPADRRAQRDCEARCGNGAGSASAELPQPDGILPDRSALSAAPALSVHGLSEGSCGQARNSRRTPQSTQSSRRRPCTV